jgi:hypothetical protein
MNESHREELSFLRDQIAETDRKIARLRSALDTCHDCLEADGLNTMLHTAELERDLLRDLSARQAAGDAVSLDAVILQIAQRLHQQAAQHSETWQRGQPTPPAYWEAEAKQAFLLNLLRRFHAVSATANGDLNGSAATNGSANGQDDRDDQNHAHPWFDANHAPTHHLSDAPGALDTLTQAIHTALHHASCPEHHLEVVVQPEGLVIATGVVHSAAERERVFTAIMSVEDVWEVVSDIKIAPPPRCPICGNQG